MLYSDISGWQKPNVDLTVGNSPNELLDMNMSQLSRLPEEILIEIIGYLDHRSVLQCALVRSLRSQSS